MLDFLDVGKGVLEYDLKRVIDVVVLNVFGFRGEVVMVVMLFKLDVERLAISFVVGSVGVLLGFSVFLESDILNKLKSLTNSLSNAIYVGVKCGEYFLEKTVEFLFW